jgi:heme exporter protein B
MSATGQFVALLRKDLLAESRRLQTLLTMIIFAILAMVVFRYGWAAGGAGGASGAGAARDDLPASMLWVVFVFAVLLGFGRTFAHEREDDCLDGLLLCPVGRVVLFAAKATANLLFLVAVQIVIVPVFAVFFLSSPATRLLAVLPVAALADLGMAVLGTLLATLVLHARSRDLVLPIVLLPLLVPLLIAATSATQAIVGDGASLGDVAGRLIFLAVYDLVFLVASWGTYEYLVSE